MYPGDCGCVLGLISIILTTINYFQSFYQVLFNRNGIYANLQFYVRLCLVLGRVDGNSSYNSMGDNWGSHRFAQVKLEFSKTYIFSPS